MATISLNLSGSLARISNSFTASAKTATGHGSTIQAEASCSVSYNSTSKTYTVQTVYLKIKGQPSGTSAAVQTAFSQNTSNNWASFNFKPSKTSGSMTLNWTSYSNVTYSSSTVSVSDTYTNNYKDATATCIFSFKVTTTEGTEYYTLYVYLDFRLYGAKPIQYTVAYYQNNDFGGDLISSSTVNAGTTVYVKSAYNRSLSSTNIPRYVYFNTLGGIPAQDTRDKSTTQSRRYVFDSWSGRQPSSSLLVNSNVSMTEQYHIDYGTITYKTVGSLPTVYKKGYIKTNMWFDQNNGAVDASTEVSTNLTLHPEWEPQNYRIAFNLNGGQMPEDMGKISDYTTDKTYDSNSARTPNFTPLRLGYKFIGWSDQTKSITPIGVNEFIPDTFYNAINTEYTNNNVTLYAQWEYNVNTVKCVYYLTDSGSEQVDTHTYNIDTATLDPQGDKAFLKYAPNQLRSGDFVFLGWLDAKPDGWDTSSLVNNGYHGTYTVPPEKVVDTQGHEIEIELPIDIKIKNYKDLNDWGIIETYYGIWAKTGKYMKINGSWKKVNKCYVKINGEWKIVTDIWTKQNSSWKHEI